MPFCSEFQPSWWNYIVNLIGPFSMEWFFLLNGLMDFWRKVPRVLLCTSYAAYPLEYLKRTASVHQSVIKNFQFFSEPSPGSGLVLVLIKKLSNCLAQTRDTIPEKNNVIKKSIEHASLNAQVSGYLDFDLTICPRFCGFLIKKVTIVKF